MKTKQIILTTSMTLVVILGLVAAVSLKPEKSINLIPSETAGSCGHWPVSNSVLNNANAMNVGVGYMSSHGLVCLSGNYEALRIHPATDFFIGSKAGGANLFNKKEHSVIGITTPHKLDENANALLPVTLAFKLGNTRTYWNNN